VIPPFNDDGCLPEGIYDCAIDEAAERLGSFQSSDRRPQLWARFTEFIREAKGCGFMEAVLVGGSFVTAIPEPNDINLVLEVAAACDFSIDLSPAQYNLLAQQRGGGGLVLI